MFSTVYDVLYKSNFFGFVTFLIPFVVFFYYSRLHATKAWDGKRKFQTGEEELAEHHEYRKKRQEMLETSRVSEHVGNPRRNDEIVYLSKLTLTENDLEDRERTETRACHRDKDNDEGEQMADRCSDLQKHFKQIYGAKEVAIFPIGVNILYKALKLLDDYVMFADSGVSTGVKSALKELEVTVKYFNSDDSDGLKKGVSETKNSRNNCLLLETLVESTGKHRDTNPALVKSARDQHMKIIALAGVFSYFPNPRQIHDFDLILFDETYLHDYISGFAYIAPALLRSPSNSARPRIALSPKMYDCVTRPEKSLVLLRRVAKEMHQRLKSITRIEVLSHEESYVKVFKVRIGSTRENYDKTFAGFCRANSVYVDLNCDGVVLHLYARLGGEPAKIEYVTKVFKNAVKFCLEKEHIARRL